MPPESTIALVERDAADILFRLPGRAVTAGQFAADAARLADLLPGGGHALNLCTGRYAFAVAFAAALLRGKASILSSDRSPARIGALAQDHPGLFALTDGPDAPIPHHLVPQPGLEGGPIPTVPADWLAAIVYTSGSTGEPVAHRKRWAALVSRSRAAGVAFGMAAERPAHIVGTVPPQHMYGFETTVLLPLHAPAASWCGPAFYAADIRAGLLAADEPRWLVTTPLHLRTLSQAALPALHGVISATAPLDTAEAVAAERRWDCRVHEIFGATEVGSIAHRRTATDEGWTPYPDVTLREEAGVCWVHGTAADPNPLADAVDLAADGRFRLLGRRTDLVKLGGHRASLAALNRTLLEVDGVQDGVFVPPGDADHGAAARMMAFVVAPNRAAPAILAALRGRMDPVFLPRRIVHLDRLPRNELGKLPHAALSALRASA